MSDKLVRQLEYFLDNNGDIKEFKRLLAVSGTDEEFLEMLRKKNRKTVD